MCCLITWVPVGVSIWAINPKAASVDHICEQGNASGLVSLIFQVNQTYLKRLIQFYHSRPLFPKGKNSLPETQLLPAPTLSVDISAWHPTKIPDITQLIY